MKIFETKIKVISVLCLLLLPVFVLADSAPPPWPLHHQHWYNNGWLVILAVFGINLIINTIIILFFIRKNRISVVLKINSLKRIAGLTVLGLIADFIGLAAVAFTEDHIIKTTGMDLFVLGLIVFILVGLNYYWIYSKTISDDTKIRRRHSMIFGIISNPVWFALFSHLFSK